MELRSITEQSVMSGTVSMQSQLRESNITPDRVYTMLAELLIELKLHEEQDKIAQIVTGSSGFRRIFFPNARKRSTGGFGTGRNAGKRSTGAVLKAEVEITILSFKK